MGRDGSCILNLGSTDYYYGMVRTNAPGTYGGIGYVVGDRAAASRISTIRLGVETNAETVVAHETGHMLGRSHTNTDNPQANTNPPGCYNFANSSNPYRPYANNTIQSGPAATPAERLALMSRHKRRFSRM